MPLDTESVSDAAEPQPSQTGSFRLTALRPGASKIAVELYRGDTYETTLETEVQVTGLEDIALLEGRLTVQPRPVPQPDLTLQVSTSWNEAASAYIFHYQLKSFRASTMFAGRIPYRSQAIAARWLTQVREIWQTALEAASEASPEDTWSRLTSLGQHLFQRLFPTKLQQDLRNLSDYPISNLLVLADREAQFPWGLLHTGQKFLGERLIIGQWPWELNDARPYEFPVGAINFAHYANVEQPEIWAALLKPPHAPDPNLLAGGLFDDLATTESMRGLHLMRCGQLGEAGARRYAPVPLDSAWEGQEIEQQVRPAKLNLRRNRPLVTLGYVRRDRPEMTDLEANWASAFIKAGCSAFIGSLWA